MADIIHRIGIKSSTSKVYAALSTIEGLAGWWTKDTSGISEVGGTITFRFFSPDGALKGEMGMEVLTLDSNKRVQWRVVSGPPEWIGTEIMFTLTQEAETAILIFSHKNWPKQAEFMAHCSMKWATFLLSLRELVETGHGKPSPDDLKIDNWN